ncbi:MAG: flagellar motor protein MotB [Bdellovibrionota bacterium]
MPEGPDGKTIIIIKKVSGHGGHHGGAWKVAYADFVTAMMAFFMVLWLVNSASVSTRERIASYFREPGVFEKGSGTPIEEGGAGILKDAFSPPAQENSTAIHSEKIYRVSPAMGKHPDAYDVSEGTGKGEEQIRIKQQSDLEELENKLIQQLQAAAAAAGPDAQNLKYEVKVDQRGLHIEIMDTDSASMFALGSARMSEEAEDELTKIAKILSALPNPIDIEGHTDGKPFHPSTSDQYDNWNLSADRANAARRVLIKAGIKQKQLARVVGYADQRLKVPSDAFAAANRRISISMRFTELAEKALEGTKTRVMEPKTVPPVNPPARPPVVNTPNSAEENVAKQTTPTQPATQEGKAPTPPKEEPKKGLAIEVGTTAPEGEPLTGDSEGSSSWMEKDKIFGNKNPFFGR